MTIKANNVKKQYKIIEVALDEEGMFWLYYIGDVVEQGGCRFGKGSMGFRTLQDCLAVAEHIAGDNMGKYKELMKKKV